MPPVEEFGFERQSNAQIAVPRLTMYRAPTGDTVDRISLVFTTPTDTFMGTHAHWDQAARTYIQCESETGVTAECCRALGRPRMRMGAVVLVYSRDRGWTPNSGWTVHPWLFSERTFSQLREINGTHPLASHDIRVHSTDNQYQRLEIRPTNRCLWREGSDEDATDLRLAVMADRERAWEFLRQAMGRRMNDQDIVSRRASNAPVNRQLENLFTMETTPVRRQNNFIEDAEVQVRYDIHTGSKVEEDKPPPPKVGRYELAKRRKIRMEKDND